MELSLTIDRVISEIYYHYYNKLQEVDAEDYSEISRLLCDMFDDIAEVRYLKSYSELFEKVDGFKFSLSESLKDEIIRGRGKENDGLEL